MDPDARDSCLRAVRLVARSARLCAEVEPLSPQYVTSLESASRMVDRAEKYYVEMKAEHEPHERLVRLVGQAVHCAKECLGVLQAPDAEDEDGNDLLNSAEKIERAIARAGGVSSDPPASTDPG